MGCSRVEMNEVNNEFMRQCFALARSSRYLIVLVTDEQFRLGDREFGVVSNYQFNIGM